MHINAFVSRLYTPIKKLGNILLIFLELRGHYSTINIRTVYDYAYCF